MKNKNLLLGILGGVAVGTVLGILFAPAKGSETREKISKKGTDLKDNLKNSANRYADKFSETVDGFKNHVDEIKANVEKKY